MSDEYSSGTERYEVWRCAAGFDDDPVHVTVYGEDFDTLEEAKEALAKLADGADLLWSDYEIRPVETDTE